MAVAKTKFPIVFGAMTFGKEGVEQTRIHSLEEAGKVLDVFKSHGHNEVDTARVYGGGSSEEYLGKLDWQKRGIVIETKYFPSSARSGIPGTSHNPEDLRTHLLASLKALNTDKVDLWYLHAPDRNVPYEVTFKAINDLHKEGHFARLGVSNYPAWEVAQISEICIKNNWIRPTVYQGVYNAIHRLVEAELFPCLKHYGIKFYAYNPLAGGYLTPKYHRKEDTVENGSRFDPKTSQGALYRKRYWQDPMFDALDIIRAAAGKHNLTEVETALRWIVHHSKLREGDEVIIGASSVGQLEENLVALEKEPLPEDVVEALDKAWETTKGIAWNYFH